MIKKKDGQQKNIAQQMKGIVKIIIPVLILYIFLGGVILENIRKQAIRNMNEMSELYMDELDNRFFRISRRILINIMEDNSEESVFRKNVELICEDSQNDIQINYAIGKIREDFLQFSWEYGEEYHFFLYLEETGKFINLDLDADTDLLSDKIKRSLIEKIQSKKNTTYSIKQKWDSLFLKEGNYVYKAAQIKGIYLGCYVNVKDILEPFQKITSGGDGYVQMVSHDGQVIGRITDKGIEDNSRKKEDNENKNTGELAAGAYGAGKKEWTIIVKEMKRAPFFLELHISGEKIIGILAVVLAALLVLVLVLLSAGYGMVFYLRKYVLSPIQKFTDNLLQYDAGDYTYNITDSNLLELEQMDGQFRKMMHQIRKLKITLYEQELEKQKIEMDFLKLQIRPHFYLNCLNFIYSMIDFKEYQSARKMSAITADYLQYVFKNNLEKVKIEAELNHCRNYLDILLLRYQGGFEYYIEQNDEVINAEIFPFLIQVFVENAAKHALTMERKILISVTVYPEEREEGEFVNIYISDTGKGFPEDVLDRLNQGLSLPNANGHGFGIENCLKRFRYFYGAQGEIHFENSPLGGAIVDIHIPVEDAAGENGEINNGVMQ
ncbi:sensor histidine kinase [Robinsoniella peoriensis]|uniref:sensor histidine kinase n=1 Tax=Robinsoniella peoriensis TaxID=180332 RepID=UPI00363043AB